MIVYISPPGLGPGFSALPAEIMLGSEAILRTLEERPDVWLPEGVIFAIFIFGEED